MKWYNNDITKYEDDDLYIIIKFFLLHSPYKNCSCHKVDIKGINWLDMFSIAYLSHNLNKLIFKNDINMNSYKKFRIREFNSKIDKEDLYNDNFYQYLEIERIALITNNIPFYYDFLRHLRNAIAHCRFIIISKEDNLIFIMEDINNKDKKTSTARIVLKKTTLFKIIKFLEKNHSVNVKKFKDEIITDMLNCKKLEILKKYLISNNEYKKIRKYVNENKNKIENDLKNKKRI